VLNSVAHVLKLVAHALDSVKLVLKLVAHVLDSVAHVLKLVAHVLNSVAHVLNLVTMASYSNIVVHNYIMNNAEYSTLSCLSCTEIKN